MNGWWGGLIVGILLGITIAFAMVSIYDVYDQRRDRP